MAAPITHGSAVYQATRIEIDDAIASLVNAVQISQTPLSTQP